MDKLKNDGIINIATGLNVKSKIWKNTKIAWGDLLDKLSKPIITAETYKRFMSANKQEQGKIKDVGGFVGGFLTNGKREKTNVLYRQLITLDVDFSHENFWWDFTMLFDCAACIHSTHKSSNANPRHRLIIPLNREVSQDEYQAIARRVAGDLNIELFDQSTFDVNRLMFWPSISSDAEYYFKYQDGRWLDADYILSLYNDWHDTAEWPSSVNFDELVRTAATKQEDPMSKKGMIGIFCRTYTIQEAIAKFLPEIYSYVCDNRYTYIQGTTSGGLIIYDDKFAYSHHGTDPASGQLCNAFDLVRIHKFGHLDTGKDKDDAKKNSVKAMEDFVTELPDCKKKMAEEKFAEAKFDFAEGYEEPCDEDSDNSWVEDLDVNSKGLYENSATNINLIVQNDERIKGAFRLNTFDNKRYVAKKLPWRAISGKEPLRDVDYSGVRNYIECVYGIVSNAKVDDALALEFEKNQYHPIREYLEKLEWDMKERIDTILIDYFGAEDNEYTRASIRKMLCGAVARVMEPGIKFDMSMILVGQQGTYKSTFLKKLGMGWFSDTFSTVQGKEAYEQLQGAWLIEMAELSGLKKAEVESIKHFISKREDQFRPAYGRIVETYKRQCVFFGTTNRDDFLRDPTGNRRFLPIDVRPDFVTKSVIDDLTQYEVDQIWAEAYELYMAGEPLYLSKDEEAIATIEQHKHSEVDERRGIIEEFLSKKYPHNWDDMDLYARRNWLNDPLVYEGCKEKDFVCVAEIWCECLNKDREDMSRYVTREINDILRSIPGWESITSTKNFPIYGKQKYYKRKDSLL
jgi:predicted P-loop ATPase